MANEYLKYYIEAIWKGKRATAEAKRDIEGVGDAGTKGAKGTAALQTALKGLAASAVLSAIAKQAYDFGKASVEAFSNAEESYGKFNVVFGDFADKTEGDLEAIAEATGRSKFELIDYASTIQDTFVPLGFARDEAAKMSTQITQLAIDLASFNNLETADVVRDIQSALVGNTETLRKYGVVAQETQIKQELINLGLWDGKGAIDAQAKAQAILSLTLKGTVDAQGDAIRTADSYANKQRALEAATLDLKVAVGEGLVPALAEATSAMIPYINAITENLTVEQEWQDAVNRGIISQREYQYQFDNNADIFDRNSEAYKYLLMRVRVFDSGLQDNEATVVNYYKGMGQLAQANEDVADSSNGLSPALRRLQEEYARATQGTEEFKQKTGQSAAELEKSAQVASAFNSAFVTALDDTDAAYGRWVTTATAVGGRTDAQEQNFQDLTKEAERLRANIDSLQGGTAGLGLTQDEVNEKLATQYERLALVEGALSPLAGITTEYTNAQSRWVVDAEAMNEELFNQVASMSDNAIVTASAAIALGEYDEAQISAALNAAIIQEEIKKLAEEFVNGDITAGQMRERMQDIVDGSPYTAEVEALVDEAIGNIDKVKNKLDAIDGLVVKARIEVSGGGGIPSGAGASSGGGGGGRDVPGFAGGGIVPGPVGSPQLILAHGGEQVLTPGQQSGVTIGSMVVNVPPSGLSPQSVATAVVEQLGRL